MKKTHYVYELYNLTGTIEYVGETQNPKRRFNQHTRTNPISTSGKKYTGVGKFYKRNDIFMHIAKEFDTKRKAFNFQCMLQAVYGLETDKEIQLRNSKFIANEVTPVISKNIKTSEETHWESMNDCARGMGISAGEIWHVIHSTRHRKTARGHIFRYA